MKKRTLVITAAIWALALVAVMSSTLTLVATGSVGAADGRSMTADELEMLDRYDRLEEVRREIIENYYIDVDEDALVQGAIDGMLAALDDPYTFYYTVEDMEEQRESSFGEYKGVGMSVQMDGEGYITIVRVFSDSPAERAGIYAGDTLVAIDGDRLDIQTMKDLDEAVSRIRGEVDTDVVLTMLRNGEELDFTVTRGDVTVNYIEYQMLGDAGYIHIYEFERSTAADFKKAVDYFEDEGASGIIIDLRNNPGGMLDSVIEILDHLLPEGRVIYTEDRAGNVSSYYSDASHIDIPIVVMINGESASASEILAAAVQDYARGTLVGTTSFGKGIVQLLISFDDGAGMQFTESRYFTPEGRSIHGVGVDPDVVVEMDEDFDASIKEVDPANDNQLEVALEELEKLIGADAAAAR
ncbi:MAG: S41 family peptidase [Christensenellales bacterium]|jgi:carboxyl-terminal processing protease